jgi:type VI secretion system FHA domain protein
MANLLTWKVGADCGPNAGGGTLASMSTGPDTGLVLEITSANGAALGTERRKEFRSEGGTIGRGPGCNWTLPSEYISKRLARIQCVNGAFQVTVEGKSGLCVNDPALPLGMMQSVPLRDGDRLFIDEFEISVSLIVTQVQAVPPRTVPNGSRDPWDEPVPEPAPAQPQGDGFHLGSYEPPIINLPQKIPGTRSLKYADVAAPLVINEAMPAPISPLPPSPRPSPGPGAPSPKSGSLGQAGEQRAAPVRSERPRVEPRPTPALPEAEKGGGGLDLDSVMRAAGVDPQNVAPETAAILGQILKITVQGTIDALHSRDQLKSELRLAVTRVKPQDNNPLTFSPNASDALATLFSPRSTAFLSPVVAFERAFDDIRDHQVAMLAGLRAGFESIMQRFDPAELQARFDKQGKRGGLLGVVGKATNYWELYSAYFEDFREDRDDAFRRLFSGAFATAYEEQISQLKRERAKNPV